MSKRPASHVEKPSSRSTKYRHGMLRKAATDFVSSSSSDDEYSYCPTQYLKGLEQFQEDHLPDYDYQPEIHGLEDGDFVLSGEVGQGLGLAGLQSTQIVSQAAHQGGSKGGTFQETDIEHHYDQATNQRPTYDEFECHKPGDAETRDVTEVESNHDQGSADADGTDELSDSEDASRDSNVVSIRSTSQDMDELEASDEEWADADFECQFEEMESDNSSSSSEGDADEPKVGDRPLFVNSPISFVDSILAILTLAYKFKLSGECITAILDLIALHCPQPNICVKSLYSLKKFFSGMNAPLKFHYYCTKCNCLLVNKESVCTNCPAISFKLGHFIEMSVAHQLESLFRRDSFYTDLQYRFHRKKHDNNGIEDIYDGNVYKEQFGTNGFLSNPNNLSFMWYTDGVPLYKSSKFSIWPLYYIINELPFTKRTRTENIIIAGLWFGPSKPDGNTFLMPLYDTLQTLYNGIPVSVADFALNITVRCRLLCGTCDLPAKCMIFNTVQFNGAYGCPRCLQKGERHALGPRSGVHVYPFQDNVELRTHEGTVHHSAEAVTSGETVFGVKGPCMLARCVPDMIRSTAVDVMHSLYLGVTKRLLHLWFDSAFSRFPFSMSLMLNVIDKRLSSVKPPNFVPRTPRSIKEHLCYWKASELKAWLFYYSIPVLYGIMNSEYLEHHIQLVLAMFILNQRSISQAHLNFSMALIKSYVQQFQALYGLRFMSANIHQLLHYVDTVRDLGPLWVSSCFPFEDLNGKITRLVHGTRYAELQICSSISYIQNIPHLIHTINDNSDARIFCNKLNDMKSPKINEEICENVFSIGSYKRLMHLPIMVAEALYNADIMVGTGNCQMFYRLKKQHVLYCSKSYTNINKTVSFCVLYGEHRNVALIQSFVRWSNCNCQCLCKCEAQYFAILALQECTDMAVDCNTQSHDVFFLKKMSPTHEFLAVPVQGLISLCFCVEVNGEFHWVLPVNDIEEE